MKPEPFTIVCSAEAAPRIREMFYQSYVEDYGIEPAVAHEWIYGPPPVAPARPDPVRVALCTHDVSMHEALTVMGRSLAKSVLVLGTVGSSCAASVRDISRLLRDQQEELAKAKIDQHCFEDFQMMRLKDFAKVYPHMAPAIDLTLPEVVKPQKQRGKSQRGHNSDRDRVICKAGYC